MVKSNKDKYHNVIKNHSIDFKSAIKNIYKNKYDFDDNLDNIHKLLYGDKITDNNIILPKNPCNCCKTPVLLSFFITASANDLNFRRTSFVTRTFASTINSFSKTTPWLLGTLSKLSFCFFSVNCLSNNRFGFINSIIKS